MTSPTQKTLAFLRKEGWACQVVEHFNVYAGIRKDLFNCIDIVAIKAEESGVLGIQTTSASNITARIKKSILIPELRIWLEAGNRFVVHGWKKKKNRWQVDSREITLDSLSALS